MKIRLAGIMVILFVALGSCELVSRYFVSQYFDKPFCHLSHIIDHFYPELSMLPSSLDRSKINLLIMGGSAVTDELCHTTENLKKEFAAAGIAVHIYNLSRFSHNTRDATIKFRHCKDLGFDYVFIYNGINDTRTNNCPDNIFREDYSHVQFYSEVDILERHPELAYFTLPFVLDYEWNAAKMKMGWKKTIPREYLVANWKLLGSDTLSMGTEAVRKKMREDFRRNQDKVIGPDMVLIDSTWWSEGANIKSAISFRNNIGYIYFHKPAKTRLILTDYAWYQPQDYSLRKFLYDRLDYAEQRWPTEIYGKPANVVKGLKRHDQIIDSLAAEHSDIIYFNFNDSIPHSHFYFNDICHLADSGQIMLSHILSGQILHNIKKDALPDSRK